MLIALQKKYSQFIFTATENNIISTIIPNFQFTFGH